MTVIRTPRDLFGMTTSGLEDGQVESWIIRSAKYWFRAASTSLAKIGLIRGGRERTGALPSETEILKAIMEREPTSVLG